MAVLCPNKSIKEWKTMIAHVGEREAYRAYIAHNYTIPNAISQETLKKQIGMGKSPYIPADIMTIIENVERFNLANGTSHLVTFKRIGVNNTYTAKLDVSYLPKSPQAKMQRDRKQSHDTTRSLPEGETYEEVYDPSDDTDHLSRYPDANDVDQEVMEEQTKEEAELTSRPKFEPLIQQKRLKLNSLYKNKGQFIKANETETDPKVKIANSKHLRDISLAIDDVEQDIKDISTLKELASIGVYAEDDLTQIESILFNRNKQGQRLLASAADLDLAQRMINTWKKAGDFEGGAGEHIFYDEGEYKVRNETLKKMTDEFVQWRDRAIEFENELVRQRKILLTKRTQRTFRNLKDTDIDIDAPRRDVNFFAKNLLDISEINNILLQATASWVKKANNAARLELEGMGKEIDAKIKATGLTNFNIFRQKFNNDSDKNTGNLVHRFSYDYMETEKDVQDRRRASINMNRKRDLTSKELLFIERANRDYINWMQENTEFFNAHVLLWEEGFSDADPPTQDDIKRETDKMKALLGEKGFNDYLELNKKLVEKYKIDREATTQSIREGLSNDPGRAEDEIVQWELNNSPFAYSTIMRSENTLGATPTGRYVAVVPKAQFRDSAGKLNDAYDSNFKQIDDNESYYELHKFMLDMLKDLRNYLPYDKVKAMDMNSIPLIDKKIIEAIFEGGNLKEGFTEVYDQMKKNLRMDDLSKTGAEEQRKEHQFKYTSDEKERIDNYVLHESQNYIFNNKKAPPEELKRQWREKITDEIALESSFDLGRVMKAFASMAVTYHHRAAIEDQIRLATDVINNSLEQQVNVANEPLLNKFKDLLRPKEGMSFLKEMYENYLDVAYWGYPSNIPEGKTSKKSFTSKEKEVLAVINRSKEQLEEMRDNNLITKAQYDARSAAIKEQEDALGGVKVVSKYGDAVLQYIQLKGMGWNIFAGFSNIGFGIISNVIEGSDGRNYSMKNFRRATAITLHSLARNNSFHGWDQISNTAKKVRVLMNHFDVLKESKNELRKMGESASLFKKVGKRIKFMGPYNIQSRTEYLNQSPVMIAMMLETMVIVDGKEMSFWDAVSIEENELIIPDGMEFVSKRLEGKELTDKQKAEELDHEQFMLKQRIDKVVKMNHGNYDPDTPLAGKRKFIGRAASQFRTWAFQGFQERFGGVVDDNQLVNRKDESKKFIRKGRYQSYVSYFEDAGSLGEKGARLASIPLEILKKLIWRSTGFDGLISDKFTDTDAANMRKNMTEIVILMTLAAAFLALRGLDDDDDPKLRAARYFLINQLSRLVTDIGFYTNPMEFERLSRNAIPAFTLIIDGVEALHSAGTLLSGGEDILQSGPNKDQSRAVRDALKLVPGPNQYNKVKSAASQVYRK
jgi:hypothetical protein